MPAKTTKPDIILKLISRKSGATLTQLEKATGWNQMLASTVSGGSLP